MFSRLKNLADKYGAAGALRKLARFFLLSAEAALGPGRRERASVEALLAEIRAGNYERLVLRRGSFGWRTPLFQRAQQLARAMGRRGCLVLYEAAPPHDRLRGAQKLSEGLWLVDLRSPRLRRRIAAAASASGRPCWLMLASPESRLSPKLFDRCAAQAWGVIYDFIDAISPEISGGGRVPRRTLALFERAMADKNTLLLASSLALRRAAAARGRDALLIENGVDCAHFSSPGPCPQDPAFRALLTAGKPILCYYGALARWLDYAALRALAADGRFSLLLIGVRYDNSFEKELAGEKNLVFLGPKPYERLKDYAARCDVLLVPFRKGAVGDAASPVKLFEYMALGKPVVAGDVAECRRYSSVLIASGAEDYVRCTLRALALRGDAAFLAREREEALAADWLRRAEKLREALQKREKTADSLTLF